MKMKPYFLSLLLILSLSVSAQSPRMLLAEGFTSTTCGPCATQNPAFDALLHANTEIITSIKYHMNWPGAGNDPMYHHNPLDNSARKNYYSINSVPHVYLSGNYFHGLPANINQNTLNNYSANPSPFEIQIQHRLSENQDSVYVTMLILATQAVSGNLVAHMAVIEKEIHFTSAPGSNGEKDFYNVMKALIPSRSGTDLPDFQAGDYIILEAAWKFANVYNVDQIAVVGFVQDNLNKHVHQAANSSTETINPLHINDAAIKSITDAHQINCSGTMHPKVQLINYGSTPLTSASIDFLVNDEIVHTLNWEGSHSFLETALVDPGMFSFSLTASNVLTVNVTSVNGTSDDYAQNNILQTGFVESSDFSGQTLTLFMLLDNMPQETSWQITNGQGDIIYFGGPYETPNQVISLPIEITELGCYEFAIFDGGGNGLCCSNGLGYYALIDQGGTQIFSGQGFGSSDRNEFAYGVVGTDEDFLETLSLQIIPNPIKETAVLDLDLPENASVSLSINDMAGRSIHQQSLGMLKAGNHQISNWNQGLSKGIYLITMKVGQKTLIEKVVVQ